MSDRPTPSRLAYVIDGLHINEKARQLLDELTEHGYVIVHPDDVPEDGPEDYLSPDYYHGWDSCRRHIFGDTP